jgi:hypothetical protein
VKRGEVMPKKSSRQRRSLFSQPCLPVTAAELHFALVAAEAAASGRTPRPSFIGKYKEAVESGKIDGSKGHLVLRDIPENHAAFAIMDAFPEKTPEGEAKRRSLRWRAMFAMADVTNDPRFGAYTKVENGQSFIAGALMEAVASTPMNTGEKTPVDEIFKRAEAAMKKESANAKSEVRHR